MTEIVESLASRVSAILVDHLCLLDPPAASAELKSLGADSLDIVEIGMMCEEEFGLEIDGDDMDGFKTVADIVEYLASQGVPR